MNVCSSKWHLPAGLQRRGTYHHHPQELNPAQGREFLIINLLFSKKSQLINYQIYEKNNKETGCSVVGNAPGWGSGDRGFKSRRPDHVYPIPLCGMETWSAAFSANAEYTRRPDKERDFMSEKIHIIFTGGTIDSYYEVTKDTVVPNKETTVPAFLDSLKSYNTDLEYTTVCMKDSREITDEDRNQIIKTIEESQNDKILITHGTYTMPDTARFIKANLKRNDQVIVLTGSMVPLMGFSPSDAPYNLGYSIAKLQDLENGVYVCINSHVFSPDEVAKNLSEGKFTSIYGH